MWYFNFNEIIQWLDRVEKKLDNLSPLVKTLGNELKNITEENFNNQGFPKWSPLAESTIISRRKTGLGAGRILHNTGGLKNSLKIRHKPNGAVLESYKAYAAIHHYGGYAGRGGKAKIPARPFLSLTGREWARIENHLDKYLF